MMKIALSERWYDAFASAIESGDYTIDTENEP